MPSERAAQRREGREGGRWEGCVYAHTRTSCCLHAKVEDSNARKARVERERGEEER